MNGIHTVYNFLPKTANDIVKALGADGAVDGFESFGVVTFDLES